MAVDINETIKLLIPLGERVGFVASLVKLLVGGMFGLYLILVIIKWWQGREVNKILKSIKSDVNKLNNSMQELNETMKRKLK
jgi:hypothetical protein